MIFDTLTITVCCVLLVLGIATAFITPLIRRPKETDEEKNNDNTTLPSISIVLAVHDCEEEVERNLPYFLSQEYDGKFEVVVVDEASTEDTSETFKRLKNKFSNLYTTFIPDSSHYISRRKLALTIGVKAAKYDWILFTDASCRPADSHWLATMAAHATTDTDLILGATRYDNTATDYERLDRLVRWWRQAREAQCRMAYAYCGSNMMFRHRLFIESNGFLNSLKYLRGEYDFLANEYGERCRTSVANEPEATLTQDAPSKKTWLNDHLYHIETCKHLSHGFHHSMMTFIDALALHLNLTVQIAAIVISSLLQLHIITIAAFLSLLLNYALRLTVSHKAMQAAGEDIGAWKIPFLETFMMWRNLLLRIKHSRCDKYDFIRR
ncbi:MAG: glycosyltransferase [Prevotella sp.]